MPRLFQQASAIRVPNGFTLVELVVAMLVTVAGVLGLVGTSMVVARTAGDGARRAAAATMAQSRFESLRGAGCGIAVGASFQTARGVDESWNVTLRGNRLFEVVDSVSFPTRTGRSVHVYRSLIAC